MQATFTGYNDKSSAKRGFGRKFKDAYSVDDYLDQQDGKWGFTMDGDKPLPVSRTAQQVEALLGDNKPQEDNELKELQAAAAAFKPTPEMHAEVMAAVQKVMPEAFKELQDAGLIAPAVKSVFPTTTFGTSPAAKPDAELNAALSQHHEDGTDVQTDSTPNDAFAAFAQSQLTSRPQPAIEPAKATSNHSRVERNREEANGVKRPSAGTLCAQVWNIATELSNGDEKPTTKIAKLSEVVKAATAKGINQYTARTQYARWRVFHGVTGRAS